MELPRLATLLAGCFVFLASCGGESVRTTGDAGEAGESPGGSGGSRSGTGGSAVGSGGAAGTTVLAGGSASTPLAGSAGAGGCGTLEPPCAAPYCPDGEIVSVPCGCAYCSCASVLCPTVDCPPGTVPVRPGGACCDVCMPVVDACDTVMCAAPVDCPPDRSWQRPAGACCAACLPNEPVACPEIACNPDLECPPGYTAGDGMNGCCFECVPDPLYCVSNADCMLATQRSCCACPEAISRRRFDEEPCWIGADGRTSGACPNGTPCEACVPCPASGEAWCVEGRCTEVFVPPPK